MLTHTAYSTVKCVLSGVPFPGNQCRTFLRFTEEKLTFVGFGREEATKGKQVKKFRLIKMQSTAPYTFTGHDR